MAVRMRYTPTLTHSEGDLWIIEQVTVHDPDPAESVYGAVRESSSTLSGSLPQLRDVVARTVDAAGDERTAAVWRTLLEEIDGHLADAD